MLHPEDGRTAKNLLDRGSSMPLHVLSRGHAAMTKPAPACSNQGDRPLQQDSTKPYITGRARRRRPYIDVGT